MDKIILLAYRMTSALEVVAKLNQLEIMYSTLEEQGVVKSDIGDVWTFVEENVEDFNGSMSEVSVRMFIEAYHELAKLVKVADGYDDMGNINKDMANNALKEGRVDEMDSTKTKEETE